MKKFLSILMLVVAVFISSTNLIGCGEQPHEHSFVNGACDCGQTDPNAHEHEYVNGFCDCGEINWGEVLTKETLSNVTITTEEDLYIYRRQPIGSFPWFGDESGETKEYRTVKIADGLVQEDYHITFTPRHEEGEFVLPVVQEDVVVGTEMTQRAPSSEYGKEHDGLSNFERHFDIILNILERAPLVYDQDKGAYVAEEYMFKMRNGCCDSIAAHEVIVKIENERVTSLYFDIYVSAHDTVSTWNCDMKSTFIFSDYGTTVID